MFCFGNIDNKNKLNNIRNFNIRPISNIDINNNNNNKNNNNNNNIFYDEIGIMVIINNMKTDWHMINYNKYNTVDKIYSYFSKYYNDPNIYIEHYDNVNLKKNLLSNIVQKNPLRLFLKISTIDESN